MVFSQTSLKAQSILKVVELDRLKPGKKHQENGLNGVIAGGNPTPYPQPAPAPSCSEVRPTPPADYLKPEPAYESTMFHDTDSEFFQDLVQWCSTPAKEEQVQTIDSAKVTEARAHNTDTLHTQFSPQGWDVFDVNSPTVPASYHNTTKDSLSPQTDSFTHFTYPDLEGQKTQFQEQFLDISSLPVVMGDLGTKGAFEAEPWAAAAPLGWTSYDTEYNTDTHNTMPFIDQEDTLDMKYIASAIPQEVESNDAVVSETVVAGRGAGEAAPAAARLSLDVAHVWPGDVISTPEVLSFVEQLEKEKCPLTTTTKETKQWSSTECSLVTLEACPLAQPSPQPYEPPTPRSVSPVESEEDVSSPAARKRRRPSEDSDETYTPYAERASPRKYRRRRPNVPIKEMILALEGSQPPTKARRGRPPKRRDSAVSSVCSLDDTSSVVSSHENKYRELRDKNNEASKRSRMNRKLKELQMEQLAVDLEERNKKLKVKADILEDMTKRLKDALMTAILQK